MKKDFITATPDSGKGTDQISVACGPNPFLKTRSTSLNLSSDGGFSPKVNITQAGLPWFCTIGMTTNMTIDAGNDFFQLSFLTLNPDDIEITPNGEIIQTITVWKENFPPSSSGRDEMTEQIITINLLVSKLLLESGTHNLQVNIDGISKYMEVKNLGDYYLFYPVPDEDWTIIPTRLADRTIEISFDGGVTFPLTYNIIE
ncbi:BACON domain-containing carbohydrate-binding protein [Phocaeicola sartorii]|uniref:BACON domain-containing protein n=1 Tax=Phocaeicola sartorii TaxID=671267 RepID=UPI0025861033|nr:BACON domain-containing carbohydrate-binding protein [Phocaeicola sartorii]